MLTRLLDGLGRLVSCLLLLHHGLIRLFDVRIHFFAHDDPVQNGVLELAHVRLHFRELVFVGLAAEIEAVEPDELGASRLTINRVWDDIPKLFDCRANILRLAFRLFVVVD